jgi:putative transposase
MSASLVYLLLRELLQMLTQLARDDGAKDVEPLVLAIKSRCSADRDTAPGSSPPTGSCWPPCSGCYPDRAGQSSSSLRRRCAGTASHCWIQGELVGLGHQVAASTVWKILHHAAPAASRVRSR